MVIRIERKTTTKIFQLTVIHPPVSVSENMLPIQPAHHQLSQHGAEMSAAHISSDHQFLSVGQTQGFN